MDFSSFNQSPNAVTVAGGVQARPAPRTPPENVHIIVFASQILKVLIPHQTARAKAIRDFIAAFMLNDRNERFLVFRPASNNMEPNWTTVALDSTAAHPKLTIDPVSGCDKLVNILGGSCPDVGAVTMADQNGNVLTLEQVRAMVFQPLPGMPGAVMPAALPLAPPAPPVEPAPPNIVAPAALGSSPGFPVMHVAS